MRWRLCLWWGRSSLPAFPNAAEAATRRSRAHSSDKMAGRKGKGCKNRGEVAGGVSLASNQASRFPKHKVLAQATMTVRVVRATKTTRQFAERSNVSF